MDLLSLPAGLVLFAFAAVAAGVVAWKRDRGGVDVRGDSDVREELPPLERVPAHQVAAKAAIEQAQARVTAQVVQVQATQGAARAASVAVPVEVPAHANGPAPEAVAQFDGPGWAPTQPMPGVAVELAFADTMPAGLNAGAPSFADTMPAEIGFVAMNFADTLAVELACEERPQATPGQGRRPR